MCEPATLAAMGTAIKSAATAVTSAVSAVTSSAGFMKLASGVQAVGSIGSAVAGYQGAQAQARMQNHMYDQNQVLSLAAMRDGYQTYQQRQQQEMQAASEDIQARRMEMMKQMSTSNVAAGEAGISGLSVERVLRDIGAYASRDISNIRQNRDWTVSQLNNEMLGLKTQTQSRIASMPRAARPSMMPFILQGAAGAAGAYTTYKTGKS